MFELENRGKRSHIIGIADHISGGEVKLDGSNKPVNVYVNPGKTVKVTDECGTKLSNGFKEEIRVINIKKDKASRKE
jgi:hypothetical protein